MLDAALQYAGRGWPVFPLTGYKTPLKGSHGFKDASTDEGLIRQWWPPPAAGRRTHNIGLATGFHPPSADKTGLPAAGGTNLLVLDADGPGGLAELTELARLSAGGGLPKTLTAQTSKGFHFYYALPADVRLRSSNAKRAVRGGDGVDIRADGGYVVLPPSVNRKTGFVYRWALELPVAPAPGWLIAWCQERIGNRRGETKASPRGVQPSTFGERPGYLGGRTTAEGGRVDACENLTTRALRAERQAELPELLAALRKIPASIQYYEWFKVGAAIYDYDPSADGLAIFKAWSWSDPEHRTELDVVTCEKKWVEYQKNEDLPADRRVTKASIYMWADQHRDDIKQQEQALSSNNSSGNGAGHFGTTFPSAVGVPPNGGLKKANGNHSFQTAFNPPAADGATANGQAPGVTAAMLTPITFIDLDKDGNPRGTTTNAATAIRGLGVVCRKDAFHEKLIVGGHPIQQWAGDLSDDVVIVLRQLVKETWDFDPGERNMRDAAVGECLKNQFDPVLTYLDGLQWDGRPRIGEWVCSHLGAPETALNKAVGKLMLLAAVRRARQPGCKFDQIIALEGKEGTGKSTAIKILAGEDNFSDQHVLGASDREQQEAVTGVWLHEIAELTGMRRADVERIKAFASRTEDRARPAYGRFRKDVRRRCVFIATTNESSYLKSDTGNRRFWPIETGTIDLERIAEDRDQLWAEAALAESKRGPIALGRELWAEAAEMQHSRLETDPWEDLVTNWIEAKKLSDVSVGDLLIGSPITLPAGQVNQIAQSRMARVLHKLKFERYQKRDGDRRSWRYRLKSGDW